MDADDSWLDYVAAAAADVDDDDCDCDNSVADQKSRRIAPIRRTTKIAPDDVDIDDFGDIAAAADR